MQVFEFARSFVNMFANREQPVELDGSQQARLINMRLRKEKQGAYDPEEKKLGFLRVWSKRQGRDVQKSAVLHWTLHTKYADDHEDHIYEQVLNQLAAHGKASNLLEIEKYWTQNVMRTLGMNKDSWHDTNICANPQKIEDQYKKLTDLESKLQQGQSEERVFQASAPANARKEILGQDLICIPGFMDESNLDEDEQVKLVRYWSHSQSEKLIASGEAMLSCPDVTPSSHRIECDLAGTNSDENVIKFPAVASQASTADADPSKVEGQDYWIFEFAPVLNASKCPDFVSRHRIRRLVDYNYNSAANF